MMLRSAAVLFCLAGPATAQRPGPGGGGPRGCATGLEGDTLELGCPAGGVVTSIGFAVYGQVGGSCPTLTKGSCGADVSVHLKAACIGKVSCAMHCSHSDEGCVQGVGPTCGCAFTSGGNETKLPFVALADPCPGKKKQQGAHVTCNNTSPHSGGGGGHPTLYNLRVNSLPDPIVIDDPRPYFSWNINGASERGVISSAYEIVLREAGTTAAIWTSAKINSNRTTYIPLGSGVSLASDRAYSWGVRCWVSAAGNSSPPQPTEWVNATFSTALLQQSDWAAAEWITSPGGDAPGQFSSQMRKVFTLDAAPAVRGRLFLALPGYGTVYLNGQRLDDPETGSRSLSQFDYRVLYHTYDCTALLKPGKNVLAFYVGLGWWGHPAVPPQAKRFPYGPPTVRALLRVKLAQQLQGSSSSENSNIVEVGTNATWQQTQGPIIYDDEYNGETYDARLETPGWTTDTHDYAPGKGNKGTWTPVVLAASQPKFTLNNTIMSSAAFQPIKSMKHRVAETMSSPAPGVYVYDFTQNEPGWCKLNLVGCEAGLVVQLRHAEVLQHPPYGPRDGNVYVGNLRSAKATDIYVCKGAPAGESVEFSFTQHGFRYVELTFPSATGSQSPPAPTLETVTAVYTRSSVDLAGDLTFSDELLNKVHHNYLWGQASNLMMVPSDCDNRDERFGWTGDAALTADEANVNFDLSSFYTNWARMLDDGSQDGQVPSWVPGGPGHKGGSDASWMSAFPSAVYAIFKWNGDVLGPLARWHGLTRYIDTTFKKVGGPGKTIKNIPTGPGDWVPPPSSPDNPAFKSEPKVAGAFSAAFSFVRDVGHVAEMAITLGKTADAAKYSAMFADLKKEFHTAWWDPAKKVYAKGGQTAHSLALALDVPPTAEIKKAVVDHLVSDIVGNGNHTTCGIIGWRFQPEALSKNGHASLAYALMTQTTYPSIGYEILDPKGEPATTVWELWNSDEQGPGMNSRNHVMFAGNGVWLHTYIGGIDNAPGSIGYEHVQIASPAELIQQALAASPSAWETQSIASRHAQLKLDGTSRSASSSPPLEWTAATKETTRGQFGLFWRVVSGNGTHALSEIVPGQSSSDAGGFTLRMDVTVAANSRATTIVPLVNSAAVTIAEGSTTIWKGGGYVASGAVGVTGATKVGDTVAIEHGSGTYSFVRAG